MPTISAILSDAFLENFHYCNDQGKRNTPLLKKPLTIFFNSAMTKELEQIANTLTDKIKDIKSRSSTINLHSEQLRVKEIFIAINQATNAIFAVREKFATTITSASSKSSGVGSTHTKKLKKPGKIEEELLKALRVMEPNFNTKVLCDPSNTDVGNYPLSFCWEVLGEINNALSHLENDRPNSRAWEDTYFSMQT